LERERFEEALRTRKSSLLQKTGLAALGAAALTLVLTIGFWIMSAAKITEPAWGPEGHPLNDGMVWVAICPNYKRPISGVCIVRKGDKPDISLNSFGVDGDRWGCTWNERVLAADVRALCPR
jgi:hypothetical protein